MTQLHAVNEPALNIAIQAARRYSNALHAFVDIAPVANGRFPKQHHENVVEFPNTLTGKTTALRMLQGQCARLAKWGDKQEAYYQGLCHQLGTGHELLPVIKENHDRIMRAINSAQHVLQNPDLVVDNLREELKLAIAALEAREDCRSGLEGPAGPIGDITRQHVIRFLDAHRQKGTIPEIFQEFDILENYGWEYAKEAPNNRKRIHNLLLMPQEISRAKWETILSFANAAYDMGLEDYSAEGTGNKTIVLLSDMLERLSRHERGSKNPHMPEPCKLRHNPAIHSIHMLALTKKIFDQVAVAIMSDGKLGHQKRESALGILTKMRRSIMFSALLHDAGELHGELSEGINRAALDKEAVKQLEKTVGEIEDRVFFDNLDDLATKQRKDAEALFDSASWYGTHKKQPLRDRFVNGYELVSRKKTFEGRLLKTIDRMQSQYDYLRFQAENDGREFPKLHEPPILKSELAQAKYSPDIVAQKTKDNKEFSLNYVSYVFRDAARDQKKGKYSLRRIQARMPEENEEQRLEKYVAGMICKVMRSEYKSLMAEMSTAYDPRPQPHISSIVVHGLWKPEARCRQI